MVGAVMPKDWHEGDGYICKCAKPKPPNHSDEYFVIQMKQKDTKACEEKENGNMYGGG
jgi:hypothetical protein